MSTEHAYFSIIPANADPAAFAPFDKADFPDRASIRQKWAEVEAHVRATLDALTPDDLERQLHWPGRPPIYVWEALLQVVNHGTDHRAQVLAGLHQLGAPTFMQDFIFHAIETRAEEE
jgi:uncharacterized damage-inducible protein DinB